MMKTLVLLCALLSIIYAKIIDLTSSENVKWTFVNNNKTVTGAAKVPGGIYSDLRAAHFIGDILSGDNDVRTRWVAYDTWMYTTKFFISREDLESNVVNLVFEGLDTVAFITVNDHVPVGATDNMFVRYVFDVKDKLKDGQNELKVTFISPVEAAASRSNRLFTAPECVPPQYHGECHANQLRKMQASFAWDWGPAFPSVGIWKPVYIEAYEGAIVRSVTTHATKLGPDWNLHIRVYLETSKRVERIAGVLSAALQVEGKETLKVWTNINELTPGDGTVEAEVDINVSENYIRPWWPNGFGEQPLYDLHIQFNPRGEDETSHKFLRIGFRTIEVIEADASAIFGNTTAGKGLTFYFKVNGYPLFMKGSNWIPSNILPELGESQTDTIDDLLLAAREANMAMLRVWGGGVYESDYFYQKCDQLGILIWQDFLFACSMYPTDGPFLASVQQEIEQNVLRLQHHPSIAIWAGNNENEVALRGNWYDTSTNFRKYKSDYIRLYVDTIKPIVEDLDPDRRYLVSSPSNGKQSEKEGYVAANPYDPHYGDTHYYNYFADNWNMDTYPKTRFASEYGFQSLPSLKTMRTATNNTVDFDLHSKYSEHRQHSPNGYAYIEEQMSRHLKLDLHEPNYFHKFVFYSQIVQAMAIKYETEAYRQSQADWFTMGALYWQLNDVWQAPSWSGIEYGGKWKMLHYYAKWFFAPVLVSPHLHASDEIDVYILNDRFVPVVDARITVDIYNWSSVAPMSSKQYAVEAGPLESKLQQNIALSFLDYNKEEIFMRFSLQAPGVKSSPYNYIFPLPFKSISGLKAPDIQISVLNIVLRRSEKLEYTLNISTDCVVLFLWLETNIEGRFEDNGLILTDPMTPVKFISPKYIPPRDLQNSIEIQYYTN